MAQLSRLVTVIALWCWSTSIGFLIKTRFSQTSLLAHTQDPSASLINSLLNKMIQLGSSLQKQKTSKTISKELSPISLGFSVHQNFKILFNGSQLAMRYLALPPSNYSLLDSSLVHRKTDFEDTFTFSLSLAELTAGLNPNMFLPVVLSADIRVDTGGVGDGLLLMGSEPLRLEPVGQVTKEYKFDVEYRSSDGVDSPFSENSHRTVHVSGLNRTSSTPMLPIWMMLNSSTMAEQSYISPVQSTFRISLKWDPHPQERKLIVEDILFVRAKIELRFNVSLGIPEDIAKIVNFPLMRILIERILYLTTKSILTSVVPNLTKLLVEDYERRKAQWLREEVTF